MEAQIVSASTQAAQFTQFYYNTFDTNRENLAGLFVDVSIMQFEGNVVVGRENITKKIVGLPFKTVKHIITTTDGQPTIDNGLIVHVVGQLKTDDDPPHSFSETFHIKKDPSNNPVVLNNVFRLSLHHG